MNLSFYNLQPRQFFVGLVIMMGLLTWAWISLPSTCAFNGRDLAVINVVIPAIQAGIRAHRRGNPIGRAVIQAICGGLIMQKGFEIAANASNSNSWKAWQAKILVNTGASLAESAHDRFKFRMDLGPIWLIADSEGLQFKPGLHSTIAPLLNLSEGAKLNFDRSLRFGTLVFERKSNWDGTIGTRGALAYSNANNFITNTNGAHAGHELVHTFQYRRDAFSSLKLGTLFPKLNELIDDNWIDDTGWSLNWGTQCLWANYADKNRDFDILMEREAYYLAH